MENWSVFGDGPAKISGMVMMPSVSGPPMPFCLATCDVDELTQPSSEACAAYASYLRLPELSHLQKMRSWPGWSNELLVRPALHSLEMVFSMISCVVCDRRAYIDKEEWLRRLEALANSQLELLSLICEGDHNAPTTKQQAMSSSPTGSGQGGWQKAVRSKATVSRLSQESLLPRLATWRKAQGLVTRLHFAIEGHMIRAPFTLGLGEPNLSGKPILEYDKICTPAEVCAYLQAATGNPEDHAVATAHQIMEAWLAVAQGLVKGVEEMVVHADSDGAAKKCWILERVWKLFTSSMDLLQVMDPDDFMKLKQRLAITSAAGSKRFVSAGAAFCLRSTMLRTVTKACKELRNLVPKVVGVDVDPKGGPRLQEAIMELFNSHGQRTRGYLGLPYPYHLGAIHLLQAFQAIEVAIRQFYFTYRHLVITVMGSGDYMCAIQSEISAGDALLHLYSEPPYFPSVDGARTFLGDFWHHNAVMEEALQVAGPGSKSSSLGSSGHSSTYGKSEEDMPALGHPEYLLEQQQQRQLLAETNKSVQQPRLQKFGIGA